MSSSFVQSAPEIAEEILLKISGLPKGLKSFPKDLLSKEASDQTEKLELPRRMSLAELQKIAHKNEVDLPKIGSVSSDSWSDICGDLRKIAEVNEEAQAREVFETGAAMAAQTKIAMPPAGAVVQAAGRVARAPRPRVSAPRGAVGTGPTPQPRHPLARIFSEPATREHAAWRAHQEAGMAKIPGTAQHASASEASRQSAATKNEGEASRGRHELASHAIATAPMLGLAAGTPLAAAAILKSKDKSKEEVKIYK